ncbi:hypothetical protein ACE6H2_028385 [Prunus campanulata]
MAGCMSTPSKTIKSRKKHCQRVIKCHRKATCSTSDGTKKRNTSFKKINSDAGARVSDYAVSEFVHVDFENGATTTHRRSKVSNSTFHLTQLQWYHSQYDSNVICQEEAWFDSVSILESDSDDYFISIHGDGFPLARNPVGNISSGQVLQYERSAHFVDNGCKYEEYQSYIKIDGGKSDKITGKDECRESVRFSLISTQGYELSRLGKADEVCKSLVPQSQRKPSAVFRLSVKRRFCDAEETIEQCQLKRFLYQPRLGYIIPCCRVKKPTSRSWYEIPPSTFKFRGENYFKIDLSCYVLFVIFWQYLMILLYALLQLPTYPAAMFLGDIDGEGMSLVRYFKVSENFDKDISPQFQDSIKGPNYFEINLDIHHFSYISKKGLELF